MNTFLILAYLFFIGSLGGWVLELFYRRFISAANPERKWINPGFCVGPYVPLYGFGLTILYCFAALGDAHPIGSQLQGHLLLFFCMAVSMTLIEYIAGIGCLKLFHLRLWDYRNQWGNIQGMICPKFSLYWSLLGAAYYFLVHPHILEALRWLSENLAFSFVIGFFFGVFTIDVCYSAGIAAKLKHFAKENHVVVRYEALKADIRSHHDRMSEKSHFLLAFRSEHSLAEHLMTAHYAVDGAREALDELRENARTALAEAREDARDRFEALIEEAELRKEAITLETARKLRDSGQEASDSESSGFNGQQLP